MSSRTTAARTIQRWIRERDPITHGCIRRRFVLWRHGAALVFDAATLARYVVETGDLRDPLARVPLARHECRRLERMSGVALGTRTELRRRHEDEVERRRLVHYLCDEVVDASGIPIEALENLHAIAHPDELRACYAFFRHNGIYLALDDGGLPTGVPPGDAPGVGLDDDVGEWMRVWDDDDAVGE